MDSINYEKHIHNDPSFPIIFHLDYMSRSATFLTHWHESIEILYITEGTISVLSDASRITARKGEIVVINSNKIHHVQSLDEMSQYYCLIIDKTLSDEFGLYTEEILFKMLINDETARCKFNVIKNELLEKKTMYKTVVKSAVIDLLVYLYRFYTAEMSPLAEKAENLKTDMIKKAIRYIQDNCSKEISTSTIAAEIGLSESYFCRIFKETTGHTAVFYINFVRCSNAKKLLQSGKYTVSEVAFICGFDNLSYFSKTYKKHIGTLPSVHKNADSPDDISSIPQLYFTDFS